MFRKLYEENSSITAAPVMPADYSGTFSKVSLRQLSKSICNWTIEDRDKSDTKRDLRTSSSNSKASYSSTHSQFLSHTKNGDNNNKLLCSRRIIVVKDINPSISLKALLSQVCGGPLERVSFYRHKRTAELHFMFREHAARFFQYCTLSNDFIVNGKKLKIEWANKKNSEDLDILHPEIPSGLEEDVLNWGARRCLVFAKVVSEKTCRDSSTLYYPNAKTHFSKEFNITVMQELLSQYGEIIDIGPVISRKLCFSVHFADVRSALVAKKAIETHGSLMHEQFDGWGVWFGKDPTDIPCKM